MKLKEYELVKNMKYEEYCNYLKEKYGEITKPYYRPTFTKNASISRTKDGLLIHHIREDSGVMLSTKDVAMSQPYEWQLGENLVYCDYLEHLLLHIMLTEESEIDSPIGIGGVHNFIAIELNDVFSGFVTKQAWRYTCHQKIINDKDVFFSLMKRFKNNCKNKLFYNEKLLYRSYNQEFLLWDDDLNQKIYKQIKAIE